jgi:hypothetical protein
MLAGRRTHMPRLRLVSLIMPRRLKLALFMRPNDVRHLENPQSDTRFRVRTGPLWRWLQATVMSDRIERARCRIPGFMVKPAECLIDMESME